MNINKQNKGEKMKQEISLFILAICMLVIPCILTFLRGIKKNEEDDIIIDAIPISFYSAIVMAGWQILCLILATMVSSFTFWACYLGWPVIPFLMVGIESLGKKFKPKRKKS